MKVYSSWLRLMSTVLVVVLAATFAAPARVDAMEPFTIIAIASAAAAVFVLVIYLIVASTADKRMSEAPAERWVACTESETGSRTCWPIPAPTAELAAAGALPIQTQ